MKTAIRSLKSEHRLIILEILNKYGECPAWFIHRELNQDGHRSGQSGLSHHMKMLMEANLVTYRDEGVGRFFTINTERIQEVGRWFNQFGSYSIMAKPKKNEK